MKLRENLRRYWREHLVHVAVGGLAGFLLTTDFMLAGISLTLAQHIRQLAGYWEKRDTLCYDLAVCQTGLFIGIVVGLVLYWGWGMVQ